MLAKWYNEVVQRSAIRPINTTRDAANSLLIVAFLLSCFLRRVSEGTRTPDRLDHNESRLRSVVFDDGSELARRAVFVPFRQRQHTSIAARAGCATVASGAAVDAIATDWTGVTSVPGIWAAGTTTNPALLAIGSAGHGSFVATQLHANLMSR